MRQDADSVPVTVTVGHPPRQPHGNDGPPHSLLPFTGSAVGMLLTVGLVLALLGCTLVTVVRRRTRHTLTGRSS